MEIVACDDARCKGDCQVPIVDPDAGYRCATRPHAFKTGVRTAGAVCIDWCGFWSPTGLDPHKMHIIAMAALLGRWEAEGSGR
jgi:hypothetical protein